MARSAPDGYTYLYGGVGLVSDKLLFKSVPYDPEKDFVPVAMIYETGTFTIALHPDVPMRNVPYKAPAQLLQDAVGGRLDMVLGSYTAVEAMVKAGKLRVIGISSPQRIPTLLLNTFSSRKRFDIANHKNANW